MTRSASAAATAAAASSASERALELLAKLRDALGARAEVRAGQDEMTAAAARTIEGGGALIVQAPTGVGKSIAYLSASLASKKKVVIATSSLALQDQLANKDLPFVAASLPGQRVEFAVLKGRSNYLCRAALAEVRGAGPTRRGATREARLLSDELFDGIDAGDLERIASWAEHSPSGDRAELETEPSPRTWSAVSTSAEECPGRQACPYGQDCFAEAARARAEDADIVVVNTHLYALHIASDGWLLPEHEVAIFDEAHENESIFTAALGTELDARQLESLARQARRVVADEALIEDVRQVATALGRSLEDITRAGRGDVPDDVRLREGVYSDQSLAVALDGLARVLLQLGRALDGVPEQAPETTRTRARRVRLQVDALLRRIGALTNAGASDVVWVSADARLHLAPIEVGRRLGEWFWRGIAPDAGAAEAALDEDAEAEHERLAPQAVIFTSATIPPTLRNRLAVPDPVELDVATPFDFKNQALLYVPEIPDPRNAPAAWRQAVRDELAALINAAGGRTLALFTSAQAMREAAEELAGRVEVPILVQGAQPKARLLQAFAQDEATCLFATRSFFQGVDVPGQSLSVLALDRIPFPRPGEPLVEAWQELAGGGFAGFSAVAVPIAGVVLAQAAGRLIRTREDRGVVAVLDGRLAEANYRGALLDALPPMRRTRKRAAVAQFLKDSISPR